MEQDYYKFDTLCDLWGSFSIAQSILYCNSKRTVDFLQNKLTENNFSNAYIHGNMPQSQRKEIMSSFRAGNIRMLIATDLLCRGIDVHHVSLVINYEIPYKIDNYIHRIGRSGRFGRKGLAINFVNEREMAQIKHIEKFYSTTIEQLPEDISTILN
jgi:translation initiation factor 4A